MSDRQTGGSRHAELAFLVALAIIFGAWLWMGVQLI